MDFSFVLSFLSAVIRLTRINDDVTEIVSPTVRTTNGVVEGSLDVADNLFDSETFFGIPYARVPDGQLRFEMSFHDAEWANKIIADTLKPPCAYEFHEGHPDNLTDDCLYINILRPAFRQLKPMKPYPIVIIISGAEPKDELKMGEHKLLLRQLVQKYAIVVTLSYRRGVLGFLDINENDLLLQPYSYNNFGLYDIRNAIKFVFENAYKFYGNENKITLLGEGEGAFAVGLLARSPIIEEYLFHRVIQLDGFTPSKNFGDTPQVIKNKSRAFIQRQRESCHTQDYFRDCMQQNQLETFLNDTENFAAFNYLETEDFPLNATPTGSKRFLIGVNQCDNRSKGAQRVLKRHRDFNRTTVMFEAKLMFDSSEIAEKVVKFYEEQINYPKDDTNFYAKILVTFICDAEFKLPAVREAMDYVAAGHQVWFYEYTYPDYLGSVLHNLGSNYAARKKLNKFIYRFAVDDKVSLHEFGNKIPFIPPSFDRLPYVHFDDTNTYVKDNYRPEFRKFWQNLGEEYDVNWASLRVH